MLFVKKNVVFFSKKRGEKCRQTAENERNIGKRWLEKKLTIKKSRNSAILNVLLYIISLLSAIGTLDVIEAHFGVPFKYSFIIVVTLFILGLFWGIIEYRNHRKL